MKYTIYYWNDKQGGVSGKHFNKLSEAKKFARKKYIEGYNVSIYNTEKMNTRMLKFIK